VGEKEKDEDKMTTGSRSMYSDVLFYVCFIYLEFEEPCIGKLEQLPHNH
jgi:hypothetical protein